MGVEIGYSVFHERIINILLGNENEEVGDGRVFRKLQIKSKLKYLIFDILYQ